MLLLINLLFSDFSSEPSFTTIPNSEFSNVDEVIIMLEFSPALTDLSPTLINKFLLIKEFDPLKSTASLPILAKLNFQLHHLKIESIVCNNIMEVT